MLGEFGDVAISVEGAEAGCNTKYLFKHKHTLGYHRYFRQDMRIKVDRKQRVVLLLSPAQMVELVDTPDLGSGIERCGGSSPLLGIITE